MKFLVGLLWVACALTLYLVIYQYPNLYTRTADPRLQEFYPATVIGRDQVDMCSGFSCYTANELKLVLSDNSYQTAIVNDSKFNEAKLNSTILLERHITDPTVSERQELRMNLILLWLFLLAAAACCTTWYFLRRPVKSSNN